MKALTVFTPTYNRAHCLPQLYKSLLGQDSDDFEWLIVDDGSEDGTRALVAGWIKENRLPIRYVYQANQGMHGAHNTAYVLIQTELNMCIDSDDRLAPRAVSAILQHWQAFGGNHVSGLAGLDADAGGRLIGTPFPKKMRRSTLFALYRKHGVRGDKKLVYRSELTRRYPYPLFAGEKYVGLDYKYLMLDLEYELLLLNEVLCIVEYLPDGSSRNMLRQYRRNPRGFAFYRQALLRLPEGSAVFRYRQGVHYVSSLLLMNGEQQRKSQSVRQTMQSPYKEEVAAGFASEAMTALQSMSLPLLTDTEREVATHAPSRPGRLLLLGAWLPGVLLSWYIRWKTADISPR